jgi:hypothetical protein
MNEEMNKFPSRLRGQCRTFTGLPYACMSKWNAGTLPAIAGKMLAFPSKPS